MQSLPAGRSDPRHRRRLKKLTRLREALLHFFLGDNEFHSTEGSWRKYFYYFAHASAMEKSAVSR